MSYIKAKNIISYVLVIFILLNINLQIMSGNPDAIFVSLPYSVFVVWVSSKLIKRYLNILTGGVMIFFKIWLSLLLFGVLATFVSSLIFNFYYALNGHPDLLFTNKLGGLVCYVSVVYVVLPYSFLGSLILFFVNKRVNKQNRL